MRVKHTTDSYIAMVNETHRGKYNYSRTVFTRSRDTITVICPQHGEFYPTAHNHKKTGCPQCFEAQRGTAIRMTPEVFTERLLEASPHWKLSGTFKSASDPVDMVCNKHGPFTGVPTRMLVYPGTCPGCAADNLSTSKKLKHADDIMSAIMSLPDHISVITDNPGWSSPTTLLCEYHGEFTSELNRVVRTGMTYVCSECAKDHWTGTARVPFEKYASKLARDFPNPPSPIALVESSYTDNVGSRLVHLKCELHGDFHRHRNTVNNGRVATPCPYCKVGGVSRTENELLEFIRQRVECIQGDRTLIKPKELDCLIPSKSLAIEFCGLYWHSDSKLGKTYHVDKLCDCLDAGVGLIHIFEDEWLTKRAICESIILNRLGMNSQVKYARKLAVKECAYHDVSAFLDTNHIQGAVPAQRYYGLFEDTILVAVASFSYNRLKADGSWELVRYCSLLNTNVVGGLSKLCRYFMNTHGVARLISYCCRRWFTGSGYQAAGFTLIATLPPSYFYTNKQIRLSRHLTRKHKLDRVIPNFDPNLTETQNMVNAGFSKIYDCGNLLFELTL